MRDIKRVIVHCAATDGDVDIETIRQWHKDRGWSDVGYHHLIRVDGSVEDGRPIENAGAHTKGFNAKSIGICLAGGKSGDADYTPEQWSALRSMIDDYVEDYAVSVHGHNDYTDLKTCPNFNVAEWYYNG